LAFRNYLARFFEHLAIDIAYGNHFDWCHLQKAKQIAFAIPSRPDKPNTLWSQVGKCGCLFG
jgi:hypothetical protein